MPAEVPSFITCDHTTVTQKRMTPPGPPFFFAHIRSQVCHRVHIGIHDWYRKEQANIAYYIIGVRIVGRHAPITAITPKPNDCNGAAAPARAASQTRRPDQNLLGDFLACHLARARAGGLGRGPHLQTQAVRLADRRSTPRGGCATTLEATLESLAAECSIAPRAS